MELISPDHTSRASWAGETRGTYLRNLGVIAVFLLAVGFSVTLGIIWMKGQVAHGTIGFDFRGTLYEPAQRILDGDSPYPRPVKAELEVGNPAVYPPLSMLAVVPLSVLPWSVAVGLWAALLAVATLLAVRVLGVRDWRCYVAVLLPQTMLIGVMYGNVGVLLIPLAALAWAYRDRSPVLSGVAVGLAVATKPYLWPLALWLPATRRYSAFAASVGAAIAGTVGAWAVIGFDGMREYPDLLRVAEDVYAGHSYSLTTVAAALDLDANAGRALSLGCAAVLALAAVVAGRRGADAEAFSLCILAAILGASIAWPYTFALVVVPIAIAFPRFHLAWLAPMLFVFGEILSRPMLDAVPPGRPDGTPPVIWEFNHAPAGLWPALAYALIAVAVIALSISAVRRS